MSPMVTENVIRDRSSSSDQEVLGDKSSHSAFMFPLIAIGVKLDRGNFPMWKQQMLNLITAYGLEDFINGFKKVLDTFLESCNVNPNYSI